MSAEDIRSRGYNLDIRNPHAAEAELGDPESLLVELNTAHAEVTLARERLKEVLAEALLR